MKKSFFGLVAVFVVFILVGCSKSGDAEKVYKLTYSSSMAPTSSFHTRVEQVLIKELEEKSNGRIQVNVYTGGALSGMGTTVDAVVSGTADMGFDTTGAYAGKYPLSEFFSRPGLGIPNGEVGSLIYRDFVNSIGADEYKDLKVIAAYHTGPMALISVQPLISSKDLAGKQIRVGASQVDALKAIGATPVDLAIGDVYEALRTHVLDGLVAAPNAIPAFKFNEVAKYITMMPQLSATQFIIMNKDKYDSLPADLRKVVDEVSEDTFNICKTFFDDLNEQSIKDAGMTVVEIPSAQNKEWNEKFVALARDYAKSLDAKGQKGTDTLNWINEKLKEYSK